MDFGERKGASEMSLTDSQKELLNKLIRMPRGTVLRKGKTERILWGLMPGMIVYKTKRSKNTSTALNIFDFMKWAEKAEIIEEEK